MMKADRQFSLWRWRWIEKIHLPFNVIMTTLVGIAVLMVARNTVLMRRPLKLSMAMMAAGVMVAAFLMIPKKFNFFVYSAGFTLPFFAQLILVDRDKNVLSITGTALMFVGIAVVGLATGAIEWSAIRFEPRVTVPMLIFIGTGLLTLAVTTDLTMTLITVVQEIEMLLFFLVLINALTDESRLVIFLRGLCLGFVIECGIYYLQTVLGYSFDVMGNTRWGGTTDLESGSLSSQRGTFANTPATAALYFSIVTLVLTGFYLSKRKVSLRTMPILGMMLGLSCLILASKRAPMSGFGLAILVMLFLLPRHAPGAIRKLAIVLGSLAIPFMILLPIFLVRAGANHESAYEERANLTRVAWNMYHAHPVLGVGLGTYDTVKRYYLPPDWSGWLYTVHTQYLLILAETGAVGFSALLLLYLSVLRVAHRGIQRITPEFRPIQIAVVCALVAVYWEQLWDIFESRQQNYLYWLLVSLAVIFPRVYAAGDFPSRAKVK